jgi:hypothetical protein
MQLKFFFVLLIPLIIGCSQQKTNQALSVQYSVNNTISVEDATQHQLNYKNYLDSIRVNQDSLGNNGWIALSDLEQYIAASKDFATKNSKELSGFRLYFAKHPALNGKEGNLTFFVAPTGKDNVRTGYFQGPPETPGPEDDPDLLFSPLNYINAGRPPKKVYPFNGE